jgi:hypothetical protein
MRSEGRFGRDMMCGMNASHGILGKGKGRNEWEG